MIPYLVNCTNTIINEIESGLPQREIAKTYWLAMSSEGAGMDAPDWKKINAAIVARWSVRGLERVKKMAHGDPFGVHQETPMPNDAPPMRIQRSRKKGWRAPPNAIYVGRPTMWGNRWAIGVHSNTLGRAVETIEEAVGLYRKLMWTDPHHHAWIREKLRGHDLICWCPLNRCCHADFLLEIANAQ